MVKAPVPMQEVTIASVLPRQMDVVESADIELQFDVK